MRIALAIVAVITAFGYASTAPGESSPDAAASDKCDGVWRVDVENWLKEQANVRYLEASEEWVWLGYVSADGKHTFSISPGSTFPRGNTPHVEVEAVGDFWCSQRWKHSPPPELRNSPNFKVTIRCETAGGS